MYTARLAAGQRAASAQALEHLNQALLSLRQAGDQEFIVEALLHRAAYFRQARDLRSATRDLDEAQMMASRSHMRLLEADLHLERARLLQAQKRIADARASLAEGRRIVKQTGYHRRDPEVEQLSRQLGGT